MVRVLVCGNRDYTNVNVIEAVLNGLTALADYDFNEPELTIIEGGAKGADAIAAAWADRYDDIDHEQYPAQWDKYGKAAGPHRNRQMIEEGNPHVVYAFTHKPLAESKGTLSMVTLARKVGLPVYAVEGP